MTIIKYEQANPLPGKELPVVHTEAFILCINRAFGAFPCELGKDQLERLEGLNAGWMNTAPNPYDALIRAVKRYGSIRIWAEYDSAITFDQREAVNEA